MKEPLLVTVVAHVAVHGIVPAAVESPLTVKVLGPFGVEVVDAEVEDWCRD